MDIRFKRRKPISNELQTQATPELMHQLPKKRHRLRKILIAFLLLVALVAGYFGVKVVMATKQIISKNFTGSAAALIGGELKGEGDGRINILILGIGGPGHDGPDLTDTMMVLSIDPKAHTASMLSIPRDFYVKIPNNGWSKINAANAYGEQEHVQGGGPTLTKKVVSSVLGIPIHYYIKMDFDGFKQIVDAIGGVDVTVDQSLYDPYYPADTGHGYSPLYIKAGRQHMNGTVALRYARSRETTSDFDRAKRQQKVIQAVREKAMTLGTLSNPSKVNSIINAVGSHMKTDLQFWEIKKLMTIAKGIDNSKTTTKVLDPTTGIVESSSVGGAYVLVPTAGLGNYTQIQEWVHSYLTDSYLVAEAAKVSVYNGTGTAGLAGEVSTFLKSYGYNVVTIGNAAATQPNSTLVDYTGGKKPYTLKYLSNRFHVQATTAPATSSTDGADIKLIIGQNFQASYIGG
jgi:LCP family protein required for cell wall assembly